MSDEHETIHGKLDDLHALVSTVANHAIKLDQEVIAVGTKLDAIEPEISQTRASLNRLETALVHIAQDVQAIRDRVTEQDDRLGRRLRVLENSHANGKANGHG